MHNTRFGCYGGSLKKNAAGIRSTYGVHTAKRLGFDSAEFMITHSGYAMLC